MARPASERLDIARRVAEMRSAGRSWSQIVDSTGISQTDLHRWHTQLIRDGETSFAERRSPGRPSKFKLTEDERATLREIRLRTDSTALAVDLFAETEKCPPGLREYVASRRSRHQIPRAVRQAAHVQPEIQKKFRGPKTYNHKAYIQLRDNRIVLRDGSEREIQPGDLWELDDMSVNQPFWWEYPVGEDPLASRQKVGIGRQSLWAMDVASGKWLGFELIGRPRDAYRAEDILRFLRKLFTVYGLPRYGLRLERGIWKSRRLVGYEITDEGIQATEWQQPDMPEDDKEQLVGGLRELGIEIIYAYTANAKGHIETGFRFLQDALSAKA